MPAVFEKCRHNIAQGYHPYLLVTDKKLIGARQLAEQMCGSEITVESIETFVEHNINELRAGQENENESETLTHNLKTDYLCQKLQI